MTAPAPLCGHLWVPEDDPDAGRLGIGAVALRYAALGLPVFPLKPGTRRPERYSHGFQDATTDPAVIERWWSGNRVLNVGIATGQRSGLAVIDLDRKNPGADGVESLTGWLEQAGLEVPAGPFARTPSNGRHLYLRLPAGRALASRAGILPGVDIRADGGYVVAWPSGIACRTQRRPGDPPGIRPVYVPYELVGCPHERPDAPVLLDALAGLHGTSSGGGGGGGPAGDLPDLPPTEYLLEHGCDHPHDDNMARLAGRLVRQGLARDEAYPIWQAVADKTQEDPGWGWSRKGFDKQWGSAQEKGYGEVIALPPGAVQWAEGTMVSVQAGPAPAPPAQRPRPRPVIDCGKGTGPETIRAVREALNDGLIPGTYAASGQVVVIEEMPAGRDAVTADGDRPLPIEISEVNAASLSSLLAHQTYTYKWAGSGRENGKPKFEAAEFTPAPAHLTAALAPKAWPRLRPLTGVIGAPVLRPDATLLQQDGYDEATGLYLASRVSLPHGPVPERPAAKDVAWARWLLLDQLLVNFPWCSQADKANYLAMLVTQVLRRYLRGAPVPMFPITAAAAGSGKTLLASIPGTLFGQVKMIWTDDDDELRKQLTSLMKDQAGVITFDNLPKGTVIRSAVLSKLLTDRTWGDRLLGGNALARFANDRLWVATGNNLKIGGDNATRAVLISIDPMVPHPERRSGFAIADLESWIETPANQRKVLAAVLTLVADWVAAGCPAADVVPMRQFSAWARAAGGLLAHHDVPGFLANAGELEAMDDDSADWTQFFARWREILGGSSITSAQLLATQDDPRWAGTFPAGRGGGSLSAKGLGRRLSGERGVFHGRYRLRSQSGHESAQWYWIEVTS